MCHRKMSAFKMSENRQWIVLWQDKSKRNVPIQILIEKGLQKLKHKDTQRNQFIIIQHFVFNFYLRQSLFNRNLILYPAMFRRHLFHPWFRDLWEYDLLITENVEASNICMVEYFLWGRFIDFSHSALNHDHLFSLLHVCTCICIFCCYHTSL